jgi:transposase
MVALAVAGHLSAAELGRRYRAARDRVERGHLQVVWLLRRGRSAAEVARVMGLSGLWVAEIVRRYDEKGPDGLGDRRRGNAGARPLLGAEDEAASPEEQAQYKKLPIRNVQARVAMISR